MNAITLEHGTSSADLPGQLAPGQWRVVRRDSWSHDQGVVDALLVLREQPGVELIDPTGLLGGSRHGYDINREERAPITPSIGRTRNPPKRKASK